MKAEDLMSGASGGEGTKEGGNKSQGLGVY